MKWLILGGALVVTALAIWILARERQGGQRSSLRGLGRSLAWLVVFAAVVYAAHYVGIFSLPILAIVFVPLGLGLRWSSMLSRDARARKEAAAPPPSRSRSARARSFLVLPAYVVLVLGVAVVAYAIAIVASIR